MGCLQVCPSSLPAPAMSSPSLQPAPASPLPTAYNRPSQRKKNPLAAWAFALLYLSALGLLTYQLATFGSLEVGFALGLIGLAVVLARDIPAATGPRENSSKGILAIGILAGLTFFLGALAGSPALQMIGLGLFAIAWLARVLPWSQLGGPALLIGLICLPVPFLQGNLLLVLQRIATEMASWALDLSRVAHVRQGVILETSQGALLVEEACSGMQSLITGLIAAQIYLNWYRQGLFASLAALCSCAAFLVLGNCLRIFAIAWLFAHNIDWTKGWKHELTGLAVYLLVLALLPSLRSGLDTVGRLQFPWRRPVNPNKTKRSLIEIYPASPSQTEGLELQPLAAFRRVVSRLSKPLCLIILLMAFASLTDLLVFRQNETPSPEVDVTRLPALAEVELPDQLAGWQKDANGSEVSVIEKISLQQHLWTFRKGGLKAMIAADLPYDHQHPLRYCYLSRDWALQREGSTGIQGSLPFSYLELLSKEANRLPMLVCYDNYDLPGQRYVGGPANRKARFQARWQILLARIRGTSVAKEGLDGAGPFCQVQVVMPGATRLNSFEGQQAAELLTAARAALAGQMILKPLP